MPSALPAGAPGQLLAAAIDVFGRNGYAGTTTRKLASAAGVNLQAIAYHFGGKEGLYLAAAQHIGERIGARVAPLRVRVGARLDERGRAIDGPGARALLGEILDGIAGFFFDDEMAAFARFIVREQMEPTAAFDRIYDRVMGPQLEVMGRLVAILLDDRADSVRVRLRTFSLVGVVVAFRVAHATLARQLGWAHVGPRQLAEVKRLLRDTIAGLRPLSPRRKTS